MDRAALGAVVATRAYPWSVQMVAEPFLKLTTEPMWAEGRPGSSEHDSQLRREAASPVRTARPVAERRGCFRAGS